MSLVLNVEILGEFKKLTEATKGSQKSLSTLEDTSKKISKGINTALGAIGIGFSLTFLVNQFKESTKAAIEDQKSKVLLTKALQDNLRVSDQQVDAIEQYISKTQIATSITDDRLRPAFAKLAIATKDTDQAMRLMSIAVDVAAGTGKDLDAVVQAMSRSLAGSDTALNRLVPSVKGAADTIAELEKMFKGAAEAAADTDPYARMQIIFGEIQEQIGMALLPLLSQFSDWLASPGGQEKLQEIVDVIIELAKGFAGLIALVMEYKEVVGALIVVLVAFEVATKAAAIAQGLMNLALAAPQLLAAAAVIGFITAAYLTLTGQIKAATRAQQQYNASVSGARFQGSTPAERSFNERYGIPNTPTPSVPAVPQSTGRSNGPRAAATTQNTTVNVNINRAQVNGSQLIDEINATLRSRGQTNRVLQ